MLALLPLLRPFGWHGLLLPVTPASMMAFLEAPVPFALGVQYKTAEVMARCARVCVCVCAHARVCVCERGVPQPGPWGDGLVQLCARVV